MEALAARERYDPRQTVILIVIHSLGFSGMVYFGFYPNLAILLSAIGYFFLCHLSITVGAHRYFTHRSFTTKRPVAMTLAIFFSGVLQGPLSWWVGKHLQHHEYEDISGRDPHTPLDGFFHSHMGWLMKPTGVSIPERKHLSRFRKAGLDNEIIRWHQKYYVWLAPLMVVVLPTLLGWSLGDVWGGLLVIGFARLVVQYHTTWSVNSIGHTFGKRGDNLATNFGDLFFLPLAAILTVGEAWHANHHRASSYWRLGWLWWQIDLGAYLIWTLSKVGLVSDLQKEPNDRLRTPKAKVV
jgi:stearoyl-CoA desaturase (delta-9 desaturase)